MPMLISGANLLEQAGVSLSADSAAGGLGVLNALTTARSEVWRAPGVVEALTQIAILPVDTLAGASIAGSYTRQGTVTDDLGTPGGAVLYSMAGGSGTYMLYGPRFGVLAADRSYLLQVALRRDNGGTTGGLVLLAQLFRPSDDAYLGAFNTPMTALAQGTAWQYPTLQFAPGVNANVSLLGLVDLGAALQFAIRGAVLYQVNDYALGSKTARLKVALPAAATARVVALAAPRDGLLPLAGSTVRISASNSYPELREAYDSGDLPLTMPRGYYVHLPPAPVTARYWQLVINGPAAQSYVQFGRVWIGDALVPGSSIDADGYGPEALDEVAQAPRRRASLGIGLTETEADALDTLALAAGTQRQVLVIPRTERAAQTAILGRLTGIPQAKPRQAWGIDGGRRYAASLSVQEDA